ncbi:MAG TPA: NAD(P)/FAD-dependent oxidoreductase, partial [Kofleriaceae bacterium]|nr:NAD(P)/FAD-dependent oxidoreductase [Kofleriaceae bacterium]
LHQVCDGNHTFLGLLPTGRGPVSEESILVPSQRLVSLFWSIRGDRVDAWKKRVRELTKDADEILDQISDENQMLFASYHDVVMHRWSTRNVVYLGDAAHATSPQLGQGCNLALWDAMVLADELSAEPRDVARALDRYTRTRRGHLAFYQLATRWLTPFFQGSSRLLGVARDLGFALAGRIGPVRRKMTSTMAGVGLGLVRRSLPLPPVQLPPHRPPD